VATLACYGCTLKFPAAAQATLGRGTKGCHKAQTQPLEMFFNSAVG